MRNYLNPSISPQAYSKQLAILIGLFHSFRLLTGAIGAFFFLKSGLSLQDLTLLQIVFSFTSLISNYPMGILSDLYSSKACVLISCIFMSLYYFLCIFSPNMNVLILAHFLQALGLSLMMGASSSWMLSWCETEQQENQNYINYLGHLENEIQAIGGVISGVLGAVLAFVFQEYGYTCVFLITASLMFILFFKLMCIPSNQLKKQKFFSFTAFSLKINFQDEKIVLFFIATALITALYQPIFHFWQPFFKGFETSQRIDDNILLAICFSLFSATKYFFNRLVRSKIIADTKIEIFQLSMISTVILFCVFLIISVHPRSFIFCCFLFCLLHGALSIISKIINDQYLKNSHGLNVASTISLAEVLGRLFSLGVLFFIYFTINFIGFQGVFFFSSIICVFLLINLNLWRKIFTRRGAANV